jgi:dephospho-CoA kinase
MQNNSFETLGELFEKKDISVDGRKLGAWINEHKHAVNKSGLKNILSLSDREIQKIAKEIESIDIELLLKNKADRKTLSEKYIEKAKSFNLRFRQSDEHEHLDSLYCIGKSIMYYRDEHDKELEKLLDETEQFIHTFYFNKL